MWSLQATRTKAGGCRTNFTVSARFTLPPRTILTLEWCAECCNRCLGWFDTCVHSSCACGLLQWHRHKRHGRGKQNYGVGSVYDGDWNHGIKTGYATFIATDKFSTYTGACDSRVAALGNIRSSHLIVRA